VEDLCKAIVDQEKLPVGPSAVSIKNPDGSDVDADQFVQQMAVTSKNNRLVVSYGTASQGPIEQRLQNVEASMLMLTHLAATFRRPSTDSMSGSDSELTGSRVGSRRSS